MREDLSQLRIKDSVERNAIASQLLAIRKFERKIKPDSDYEDNRTGAEYVHALRGLTKSLDYVRRLGSTNLVLDIGAGSTRGIAEIARSPEASELDFRATVLRYRPEIEEYLGLDRTSVTSAEVLRGIEDTSVGLAISVYSVTYSAIPSAGVKRIDEILVPGLAGELLGDAGHQEACTLLA